jgi:hypothetical protein
VVPSRDDAIAAIVRARRWDHRDAAVLAAAAPLADALEAEGLAARDAGNWELAYRRLADSLKVDPSRAWNRRYAEEARDFRLGIDPASKASKAAADKASGKRPGKPATAPPRAPPPVHDAPEDDGPPAGPEPEPE